MTNPPITVEALLVLDAIDSRGSFAGAAEQLDKVPSAVSYVVQRLEEQLSVTLFVRQGRRSVLTPAGRHLLEEGRKVLGAINKLAEQTQTLSHGWEPTLRIAFDSVFELPVLLKALHTFLLEHPSVEIDISEEVMNGGWESLIDDKVDLLVGAPAPVPNQKGIRATKIGHIDRVFVAAHDHEITTLPQPVSNKTLQQYRTVIVHDSAQQVVPWSSQIIEKSTHFYVTTIEQKIQAISAGLGVGFLPKSRIVNELASGQLQVIDVDEESLPLDIYMAWKTVNKGKGLARLRELLEKVCSD